jgi:DNA-binding response OmpR family regulator
MAKLLIVDDDKAFLKLLDSILKHHGFQVNLSASGQEALNMVEQEQFDLILLDLVMPGMDGLHTCRQLRKMTNVPIILLSSLDQDMIIIELLESGADDHISKPFHIPELVERINTLLQLSAGGVTKTASVVAAGAVSINVSQQIVEISGQQIDLTPTEYRVLLLLARNAGKVVPFRMLLREGWGAEYINQVEYLHIYMRHLQQKIEADPEQPTIIERRQDIGYSIHCLTTNLYRDKKKDNDKNEASK